MPPRATSLVAVPITLALALVGCDDNGGDDSGTRATDEPPVIHIHGLGINPGDGALYAATHSGVYRIENRQAERVSRYSQDTMAFTVLGLDHFAGSGHPDLHDEALRREGHPPHLGLVESEDAGRSWQPVSLLGEADFHALSFAHDRVYGYDATGRRFMVSSDRQEWETRSSGIGMTDFAVSPDDPDTVLAGDGVQVLASTDGGRSWEPIAGVPGLVFLDWTGTAGVVALDPSGGVLVSSDGTTFRAAGELGAAPAALLLADDAWYAGVEDGAILSSQDQGKTWRVIFEEDRRRSD